MTKILTEEDPIFIAHGRGPKDLAEGIAAHLDLPVLDLNIQEYPDGEADIREIKKNLRFKKAIFVGSIPNPPDVKPNDVVMDYVFAGDALRGAAIEDLRFFIPYLPYLRKERTGEKRTALTAKRAIDTIMQVEPSKVLLLEPHEERVQLAFPSNNRPEFLWFTNLYAANISAAMKDLGVPARKVTVVAPDEGSRRRAELLTTTMRDRKVYDFQINPHFGIGLKARKGPESTRLLGMGGPEAMKDSWVILPDDIVASGGTLINPAREVKNRGAAVVLGVAAHPVLTKDENGVPKILAELDKPDSALDGLIVTNTLGLPDSIKSHPRVWVLDVSEYAALAIHNAWGIPFPDRKNGAQGSLRDLNLGRQGPLRPQEMPKPLRKILAARLKS